MRDRARLQPFGAKSKSGRRREGRERKKKKQLHTNAGRQMKSQIFDEPPLGIVVSDKDLFAPTGGKKKVGCTMYGLMKVELT